MAEVVVRVEKESETKDDVVLRFMISDTGIGISTEEMPKLFTKFHRGTSTLEYNYEGTGIGLYVSRLIVREFGGDISARSELGKGSTFTVSLPMAAKTVQNSQS